MQYIHSEFAEGAGAHAGTAVPVVQAPDGASISTMVRLRLRVRLRIMVMVMVMVGRLIDDDDMVALC